MNRKLKIVNLILAVLFMIFYACLVFNAGQSFLLIAAIIFLAFQVFQVVYAINDFSKEGKTLWFVVGIIPNVFLTCSFLIHGIQSFPSSFHFSAVILALLVYLVLIILILLHYLLVIVSKINYWKKKKNA